MLTKNKNPNVGYIGRVLVLPLALLLFAAFTLKSKTFEKVAGAQNNSTEAAKETIDRRVLASIINYNNQKNRIKTIIENDKLLNVLKNDTVPGKSGTTSPPVGKFTKLAIREKDILTIDLNTLYVIDGKLQDNNFNLKSLPTQDIEQLNVLTRQGAIDKYGDKGKNGIIEITTKNKSMKESSVPKAPSIKNLNEVVLVGFGTFDPKDIEHNQDDPIFTETENEPGFPGGRAAWSRYLMKNLNADMPVQEGWKLGKYTITVSFIVRKDGTVADIKTDDYPGSKTSEQCIDLIRNGPKWQPALQNGHQVNAFRKQPITFIVEKK